MPPSRPPCHKHLEQDYATAWEQWERIGAQAAWEDATADGLTEGDATGEVRADRPRPDTRHRGGQRSLTVQAGPILGRVPSSIMREVAEALRLHLQL